jgi:hypothetical protein
MEIFGRDWWPAEARAPRLRLAAGLILSPLLLAALATGLAFVVAGSALTDGEAVRTATTRAGFAAFAGLPVFSLTAGLAALLALWAARRRGAWEFALAGAVAGPFFAVLTALAFGAPLTGPGLAIMAVIGAVHMLIVRRIAGIRRTAPDEDQ